MATEEMTPDGYWDWTTETGDWLDEQDAFADTTRWLGEDRIARDFRPAEGLMAFRPINGLQWRFFERLMEQMAEDFDGSMEIDIEAGEARLSYE